MHPSVGDPAHPLEVTVKVLLGPDLRVILITPGPSRLSQHFGKLEPSQLLSNGLHDKAASLALSCHLIEFFHQLFG